MKHRKVSKLISQNPRWFDILHLLVAGLINDVTLDIVPEQVVYNLVPH